MNLYEHIFLARQDISQQRVNQLVEHYKNFISENGGKVVNVENWGLRPLAYRIQKNRKAYYTLMNIDAPSEIIPQMEHQMRLSEDILRYMTIRVEEHDKEPSPMVSRREKEERFSKVDTDNDMGEKN